MCVHACVCVYVHVCGSIHVDGTLLCSYKCAYLCVRLRVRAFLCVRTSTSASHGSFSLPQHISPYLPVPPRNKALHWCRQVCPKMMTSANRRSCQHNATGFPNHQSLAFSMQRKGRGSRLCVCVCFFFVLLAPRIARIAGIVARSRPDRSCREQPGPE